MANALPLLVLAGGAALLLSKKKKKKKTTTTKKLACPPEVMLDPELVEQVMVELKDDGGNIWEVNIAKVALEAARGGEKNIISLTEGVLSRFMPPHCMADPNVSVKIIGMETVPNAPSVFFLTGVGLAEDLGHIGEYTGEEVVRAQSDLINWWNQHMPGKSLPDD